MTPPGHCEQPMLTLATCSDGSAGRARTRVELRCRVCFTRGALTLSEPQSHVSTPPEHREEAS